MQCRNLLPALIVAAAMTPVPLAAQQPAQKQSPPLAAEKIAATVNGDNVLESEVTSALQRQLRGRTLSSQQSKAVRQRILTTIIDARLVEQFLAGKKIQADPKAVEATIEQIKKRVAAAGMPFDEALKRQGLSEPTLRKRLVGELAFQKYSDSATTDRQVTDYFNAHKGDFDGSEVRASHILVKFPDNSTPADREAALSKIQTINQEITKGLDFAEAAKKYSDCPSKSEGGDLNFFPRHNRMVEPFAAAAFALPKGGVSEPVQSEFGWHLIKVTDRKQGDKGLNDVREEIKELLARQLFEKTVEEQRKVAKIEIRS